MDKLLYSLDGGDVLHANRQVGEHLVNIFMSVANRKKGEDHFLKDSEVDK